MATRRTVASAADEVWAEAYLRDLAARRAAGVPEWRVHSAALAAAGAAQDGFVRREVAFWVPPRSVFASVLTLGLYELWRRTYVVRQVRAREARLGVSFGGPTRR